MYFCPCSCDDPIDPETEENTLCVLPRNLSYVQDSYLDRYSVSAHFVHNPKIERCFQREQGQGWRANVEDETLGLLSAITEQELQGRCHGGFNSVTSSGFVFPNADSSSESVSSRIYSNSSSTWSGATPFSASSLLHPASLVAAKISAFLHSPPNETMSTARDIGTSVDGDNINIPLQADNLSKIDLPTLECPGCSEDIDKGDIVKFFTSNHSEDSDIDEHDASFHEEDKCVDKNDASVHTGNNLVSTTVDDVLDDPVVVECTSDASVLGFVSTNDDKDNDREVSTCINTPLLVSYNLIKQPFVTESAVDSDILHQKPVDIKSVLQSVDNINQPPVDTKSLPLSPTEDVCFLKEDIHKNSDITYSGSSIKPISTPVVKSFDVRIKIQSPEVDIPPDIEKGKSTDPHTSYGSPDSDAFSEEGVFVNIDDLDSTNEKSTTVSDASDDTCVSADSMFLSPEEGDLEEEDAQEPVRKMTLEEAISRAATDLTKMSLEMYGASNASSTATLLDVDEDIKFSPLGLKTAGRSSPIRGSSGLKINIIDQSGVETPNCLIDTPTALTESPIYTDQEFNFCRVQLRKSSSLKSNKTPPGTPHRKKVVRFADAMGLDLESVRHVLNMESPPKIPPSALADLMKGFDDEVKDVGSRYLCPCFSQPGAADNFFARVRGQKVCLENAIINDLTITGFVRVANISYHKTVRIRYTHNSWSSFYDIAASYCLNSCDGPTDRFSFSIVAPPYFGPGSRLEFAVCFIADGVEYWDNNEGKNYVFECFAKSLPTDSETAWLHFL